MLQYVIEERGVASEVAMLLEEGDCFQSLESAAGSSEAGSIKPVLRAIILQ